jgi:hypothetical protein
MDPIVVIFGLVVLMVVFFGGSSAPEPPQVMIVQVERPREQGMGCVPFLIMLLVGILFFAAMFAR